MARTWSSILRHPLSNDKELYDFLLQNLSHLVSGKLFQKQDFFWAFPVQKMRLAMIFHLLFSEDGSGFGITAAATFSPISHPEFLPRRLPILSHDD